MKLRKPSALVAQCRAKQPYHFDDCLLVTGRGQAQADVGNYIGRTMVEIEVREWYAEDVGLVRMERDEKTGAAALSAGRLVMELDTWSDD